MKRVAQESDDGENCQEALQSMEWRVEEVNFGSTASSDQLHNLPEQLHNLRNCTVLIRRA